LPEESSDEAATNSRSFSKYRIVIFAIAILGSGIALSTISGIYLGAMSHCKSFNASEFGPGDIVIATCPVVRDMGQDLTFRARFYGASASSAEDTIKVQAHVQIRDPSNTILYDEDFEDRLVISFKPAGFGEYTASITNLEEEPRATATKYTEIRYALGFLSYPDVPNPVPDALSAMSVIGSLMMVFGAIFVVISLVKAAAKRKNSIVF
jgi:hypothetical protein